MEEKNNKTDYIFEISWEVGNKVGGIHTVQSTKSENLIEKFGDKVIFIGPDLNIENSENTEFVEDRKLLLQWRQKAATQGIRIRAGRWKIKNNPIILLVDFTNFISQKNEIFTKYWEEYKLNSLSGRWDYVEATLFGHAVGKTIENFYNFHFQKQEKVIAHFHEWMSGAGILYLKTNAPHIATVFTTHATTLGRSISNNMQSLYKKLTEYDPRTKSQELNIASRHSLEEMAAQNADCFTTVSEITAQECKHFLKKEIDIITPNGFSKSLIPTHEKYPEKRDKARKTLIRIAEALTGHKFSEDTLLIATSGRYEFRNKGIDLYIDALKKLNENNNLHREILSFIFIPSNIKAPRRDLSERLKNDNTYQEPLRDSFITHEIHDMDNDPIILKIKSLNLNNNKTDKVKLIFVPIYLDGYDEIIKLKYYDTLMGLDLTIFPSYYEPWGYTPLESMAFHIPTITTSLAGFGKWIEDKAQSIESGVCVLKRNDTNYDEALNELTKNIYQFSIKDENQINTIRQNAFNLSQNALWTNFIQYYYISYDIALSKKNKKQYPIHLQDIDNNIQEETIKIANEPIWKRVIVDTTLPKPIKGLQELSKNVYWSWDIGARKLFKNIDPDLWNREGRNPITFLKTIPYGRLEELATNKEYLKLYNTVYRKFQNYIKEKPTKGSPSIAYFSMEYGIINSLKIYSGGLGILAGDYLKQASDSNFNMVGIGLLYRYGYFKQKLTLSGEQKDFYYQQSFSKIPITPVREQNGNIKQISISFPGREIYVRIWQVNIGRIKLYLLDTDLALNTMEDKEITYKLYGGDWENRLKQEILLGIGGIKLLEALNIKPDLYHCNEGHAAFLNLQRLDKYINSDKLLFNEALEVVRSTSLFTTHTPVPAGHDAFEENMIRTYFRNIPKQLKISWEEFISLGRENPNNPYEKFSMSILAIKTSHQINGVSKLHGEVSRDMFKNLWKGYFKNELHIDHVTNGVHYPTWTAKEWRNLYETTFGNNFLNDQSNTSYWEKIKEVPDEKIWSIKKIRKEKLFNYIKKRLTKNWIERHEPPKKIIEIQNTINPDILTIGFARRFATYKRAHLLFYDLDRLTKIVNNKEKPIQFIFAGKAHPHDHAGQGLIKMIIDIANRPEFLGKIIFLQNYDMRLAKRMVKGVDIWINTPKRPQEASGTSGQKAQMNGVLNFSVLDGWWCEGYKNKAGWALPQEKTFADQNYQDQLDATTIYGLLENEIIPLYYAKNKKGISPGWIKYIKNSIAHINPHFTTKRMIDDYNNKFYSKMFKRIKTIKKEKYKIVTELSKWKNHVEKYWNEIRIINIDFPFNDNSHVILNKEYDLKVVLYLGQLKDFDIRVEAILANEITDITNNEVLPREFVLEKKENSMAFYKFKLNIENSGSFKLGLRISPFNPNLAHRQDFCFTKWI